MEKRRVRVLPVEPDAVGFAGARAIVVVRSEVCVKKVGAVRVETRYYLTSQEAQERSHQGWQDLIRGHWAGVEIRNHWRRDALMGEDRSRTRNPRALGNLAILRNVILALIADEAASLPVLRERLHSDPAACLALLHRR